jgi:hypothetical protein
VGRSLSPFQRDILRALARWPSYEQVRHDTVVGWALPREIMAVVGRDSTKANRASLSRALLSLYERGLVARASGTPAMQGKSFRYLLITDPRNAGAGNSGPAIMNWHRRPRLIRR